MARDGSNFECTRAHNHGPDPWYVEEMILRRRIMEAVASGDPASYSVILRNVGMRGMFSLEARSRLTLDRLRTALRDERQRFLPDIPNTLFHLGLSLQQPQYHVTRTIDGNDNIFAGYCGDFAAQTFSVVFMSQRQSTLLERASNVYSDATFKKRPSKPESCQLEVISCVWYNEHTTTKHVVTCARILMQKRTIEAYCALFNYLKTLMPNWNQQCIVCDHELAQVRAWMIVFPNARMSTCLFHYSVDCFRNAKMLGLKQLMDASWIVKKVVQCSAVLALLPMQFFVKGMYALGYWALYMGVMVHPLVQRFFQYLENQWIPAVAYVSVYAMEDRTDNVSESVHATFGLEMRENRPNIWSLVAFKRVEDQCIVDHGLQRGRNVGRPQAIKTPRNDARIRDLTDSLLRGNINIMTFLLEASESVEASFNHVFH